MKRSLINLVGVMLAPLFIILLVLDIFFGIYLRWKPLLQAVYISLRVLYRLTNGHILLLYKFTTSAKQFISNSYSSCFSPSSQHDPSLLENISLYGYHFQPNYFNFPDKIYKLLSQIPVKSDIYDSNQFLYANIHSAAADPSRLLSRFFFRIDDILRIPEFLNCVSDKKINDVARSFLGDSFALVGINAWAVLPKPELSVSQSSFNSDVISSCQAQLFHYDCDWPRFLKVFINISDSTIDSAPFEYLSHTQKCSKYKFKDKRIKSINQNNYPLFDYIADSGSILYADTLGLHRDGDPGKESRYVLQLEFSISPYGNPLTLCKLTPNTFELLKNSYLKSHFSMSQCSSILRALR